jgi:hypothetical protein
MLLLPTLRSLLIAFLVASIFLTLEPASSARHAGPAPLVDAASAAAARQ